MVDYIKQLNTLQKPLTYEDELMNQLDQEEYHREEIQGKLSKYGVVLIDNNNC